MGALGPNSRRRQIEARPSASPRTVEMKSLMIMSSGCWVQKATVYLVSGFVCRSMRVHKFKWEGRIGFEADYGCLGPPVGSRTSWEQ